MADNAIYGWSPTADSNTTAADSTAGMPEGMLASLVNNRVRGLMARVAAFVDTLGGVATYGGAADAYTITSPSGHALTAYAAGQIFTLVPGNTNTTTSTVNIDGLGAKTIKRPNGSNVAAGDLVAGGRYLLMYDGTNFQVVGDVAQAAPQVTTIELGHASDTTLARVSAGVMSVEGAPVITSASLLTQTAGNALVSNGTSWLSEPLDVYNAIINGDFEIAQRGTSFASVADGTVIADGNWRYYKSGASAVHDVSIVAPGSTLSLVGRDYTKSLLVDCTTADASVAAGDAVLVQCAIEGQFWAPLHQRQVTVSFLHKHTKAGTYAVALRNGGNDRSCVMHYTQDVSDAIEYATVTFPASPSSGTWNLTTGTGVSLVFTLMGGSSFQTTVGAWQTGNYFSSSSAVNACDSASNNFQIWGIRLVAGSVAKPLIQRPFAQELALCKRYCHVLDAGGLTTLVGIGHVWSGIYVDTYMNWPTMRAAPSLSAGSPAWSTAPTGNEVGFFNKQTAAWTTISGALTMSIAGATKDGGVIRAQAGTSFSGTTGDLGDFYLGSTAKLILSAEL